MQQRFSPQRAALKQTNETLKSQMQTKVNFNESTEVGIRGYDGSLLQAINDGNDAVKAFLAQHGQYARELINVGDRSGETPLTAAIAKKDAEVVKTLLEAGASVHLKTDYPGGDGQITPLMAAAKTGNIEIVHLLLQAGALSTINVATYSGKTAYDFAMAKKCHAIADLLNHTIKIKQMMEKYNLSFVQAEAYVNLHAEDREWILQGYSLVKYNNTLPNGAPGLAPLPADLFYQITMQKLGLSMEDTVAIIDAVLTHFDVSQIITIPNSCRRAGIRETLGSATHYILYCLNSAFEHENNPSLRLTDNGLEFYFENIEQARCLMDYLKENGFETHIIEEGSFDKIKDFGPFNVRVTITSFKEIQQYVEKLCQFDPALTRGLFLVSGMGLPYFRETDMFGLLRGKIEKFVRDQESISPYSFFANQREDKKTILAAVQVIAEIGNALHTREHKFTDHVFDEEQKARFNEIARTTMKLNYAEWKCLEFVLNKGEAPKQANQKVMKK